MQDTCTCDRVLSCTYLIKNNSGFEKSYVRHGNCMNQHCLAEISISYEPFRHLNVDELLACSSSTASLRAGLVACDKFILTLTPKPKIGMSLS